MGTTNKPTEIKLEQISKTIKQTVYKDGNVSIEMTVDTMNGKVLFSGYINGEYVPFSRDDHIFSTVRVLNNQLFEKL